MTSRSCTFVSFSLLISLYLAVPSDAFGQKNKFLRHDEKKVIQVNTEELKLLGFSQLLARSGKSIEIGIVPENFNIVIVEELRRFGYNMAGYENIVFGVNKTGKAELLLGGTIDKGQCLDTVYPANNICHLQITWEVFDKTSQMVRYSTTTSSFLMGNKAEGVTENRLKELVVDCLKSLLSRPNFVSSVSKTSASALTSKANKRFSSISEFKKCKAPKLNLPAKIKRAMDASIFIKTDRGIGSGVLISPDGYAITAFHLVHGSQAIEYKTNSGKSGSAQLLRYDSEQDVALLKLDIEKTNCLSVSYFLPSTGKELYVIGSPAGGGLGFTVSKGIVSGTILIEGAQYIQTDASLNPGNSGGPMVTKDGKVVGIVSWKIVGKEFEGLGFGTPSALALTKLSITPGPKSTINSIPAGNQNNNPQEVVDPPDPYPKRIDQLLKR